MALEQRKCPSCGLVNPPGALVCKECGTSLEAPYVAPAATAVPDDTVVVHREGVSQSAIAVMVLFGLVALVAVGLLMYQWGRTNDAEDDLARERAADTRPVETRPAPATTEPAPAPVVIPPSAPPVTVTVPPVTTTAPAGKSSSSQQSGCSAYAAEIDPLLQDWNEQLTAAEVATGADVDAAVTRLQEIQRKASHVSAPACAARAHGHLLTAMTSMIDAIKAAHDQPVTSTTAFQEAERLFDQFQTEYDGLRAA